MVHRNDALKAKQSHLIIESCVGLRLLRRNYLFFKSLIFTLLLAMTMQCGAASEALNSVLREEAHFIVIARHVMNFSG